MSYSSTKDQAIREICSKHFHQAFWLSPTSTHGRLKVTFSTTANFDNASLPAVLFIGPLFSTRWIALSFNKIAQDCGVRIICVDRPAFGGSTAVAINNRMRIWLETVPALLRRLDVEHVAIVTHSAGTIYTLNTLFHYRSLLNPEAPYVAFLAPFVPASHSGATLPTVAATLPVPLLDSFASLSTFVNNKIMPSTSWSGGIISAATAPFACSGSTDNLGSETSMSTTAAERYGFDEGTAKLIEKLSSKYQFAENLTGANEEVKLVLRKGDDADWGEAANYASCVRRIALNEAALNDRKSNAAKLIVEAFFGGSDVMIAQRGQRYFEQCWQSDDVRGKIEFATSTLTEANHDSVLIDFQKGAVKIVFERIAQLSKNRV